MNSIMELNYWTAFWILLWLSAESRLTCESLRTNDGSFVNELFEFSHERMTAESIMCPTFYNFRVHQIEISISNSSSVILTYPLLWECVLIS
jgi:hypothetical protein